MIYYLSLGANLGEREQTINQAVSLLNSEVGQVLAQMLRKGFMLKAEMIL